MNAECRVRNEKLRKKFAFNSSFIIPHSSLFF